MRNDGHLSESHLLRHNWLVCTKLSLSMLSHFNATCLPLRLSREILGFWERCESDNGGTSPTHCTPIRSFSPVYVYCLATKVKQTSAQSSNTCPVSRWRVCDLVPPWWFRFSANGILWPNRWSDTFLTLWRRRPTREHWCVAQIPPASILLRWRRADWESLANPYNIVLCICTTVQHTVLRITITIRAITIHSNIRWIGNLLESNRCGYSRCSEPNAAIHSNILLLYQYHCESGCIHVCKLHELHACEFWKTT